MLSLSMIVRDEEARLEACLKSVEGFCDEKVVLDTGSSGWPDGAGTGG